jgi:hypothetical protein
MRRFVLSLISVALAAVAAVGVVLPPAAVQAAGTPPKQVETWAFCGLRPSDPSAAAAARSMAAAGIDAAFGPCIDAFPGYSADEPGRRYVSFADYRQLVDIYAEAGIKTVVYDKRVWSDDPLVRDAAFTYWEPVFDSIEAWDMGDEFNPGFAQWDTLIHRWNIVRSDIMVRSGIPPFTNHDRNAIDDALTDLPGSEVMTSFDVYTGDLGASFARQFGSRVQNLMCAINAYDHLGLTPTPDKIRDGMGDLIDAGCDSFLVFGGYPVYETKIFGSKSIVDRTGQATDWAAALLEGSGRSSYRSVGPARLLDTRVGSSTIDGQSQAIGARPADSVTELQVAGRAGVRSDATSAVINLTVTGATAGGYATVFPCGTARPAAAQVNYAAQTDVATSVAAKLSSSGKVCIYTLAATDIVVDVNGYLPLGSNFVPLAPARLLETRTDPTLTTVDGAYRAVGVRGAGSITELQVSGRGGVDADATDVVLTVTATNAAASGYVTVFPCTATVPTASNVNYGAGATATNTVIAPLRADGRLCIYTQASIDLVIDVNGFYPPRFGLVSVQPSRLLDTRVTPPPTYQRTELTPAVRDPNPPIILQVAGRAGLPTDAAAAVLNLTVTGSSRAGFLTVYPCGDTRPNASNINFAAGATVANLAVADIGTDGTVCIYRSVDAQVIVDLTNYHP